MGEGNDPFKKNLCRVQNCYFTTNKSLLKSEDDFDAILFHISGINPKSLETLSKVKRNEKQRYVFSAAAPARAGKFSQHDKIKYVSYINVPLLGGPSLCGPSL
jgi:hypothetical protein